MIEIVLCEDNEKDRIWMTDFITGHVMMENLDIKVALTTANPHDVLKYVKESNVNGGLYFFDIDFKTEITGIQLGAKIREHDPSASIVFITSHAELMSLTFEYAIEAMGYILKGDNEVTKEKIVKYIRHAVKKGSGSGLAEKFVAKIDDLIIIEDYEQILFFEIAIKRQSKVVMYTKKRSIEINSTLTEIEKMSEKFVRCHRSCVVNIDNIKSIDPITKVVYLVNGDVCEASANGTKA